MRNRAETGDCPYRTGDQHADRRPAPRLPANRRDTSQSPAIELLLSAPDDQLRSFTDPLLRASTRLRAWATNLATAVRRSQSPLTRRARHKRARR